MFQNASERTSCRGEGSQTSLARTLASPGRKVISSTREAHFAEKRAFRFGGSTISFEPPLWWHNDENESDGSGVVPSFFRQTCVSCRRQHHFAPLGQPRGIFSGPWGHAGGLQGVYRSTYSERKLGFYEVAWSSPKRQF